MWKGCGGAHLQHDAQQQHPKDLELRVELDPVHHAGLEGLLPRGEREEEECDHRGRDRLRDGLAPDQPDKPEENQLAAQLYHLNSRAHVPNFSPPHGGAQNEFGLMVLTSQYQWCVL